MRYKVVGPPGTGKTRRLLNEVQKYVDKGVPLNRIGYFAFTRKAAGEARDRFLKIKTELTKKDIKYFQTLHSLAFNRLGLKEENVMQDLNYKAIGDTCGIQIKYASYETNNWNNLCINARKRIKYNFSINNMIENYRKVWKSNLSSCDTN